MKKEYKKPELLFDSFELNASIAKTCEQAVGFGQDKCQKDDNTFAIGTCLYTPPEVDETSCYHVFSEYFSS